MAIFLKILSIIGIVLLSIIGFLLLVILLVLLFPITYKIDGEKNEQKTEAKVKISWLFGFLRVKINYPSEDPLKILLLFFQLNRKKKQEEDKQDNKPANENVPPEKPDEGSSSDETAPQESTDTKSADTNQESTESEEDIANENEKKKFSFRELYDKIIHIRDNVEYYKKLLTSKKAKELFYYCKNIVFKVLKHICPRRGKGQIRYGTGSPDTTGYVYGIYGVLIYRLPKKLVVTPDFTKAVIEGEIKLRGHIIVGYLVLQGCKLFFNKSLRQFIKKLKAGGQNNGR